MFADGKLRNAINIKLITLNNDLRCTLKLKVCHNA